MDFNRPEAEIGVGQQFPRRALDAPSRERRREQRTTMTRVICFNLGPDNGGVVTDVSSSGMGVRTDLPLSAAGDVSFSLMVDGSILRGSAEIIWMDKIGKSCGLRFTSVTSSLRLQINRWIVDPELGLPNEVESRSVAPPEPAIEEAAQTRASESQGTHQAGRETFLIDDWAEEDRQASTGRSRAFAGGILMGLILAGVAASVLVYLGLANFGRTSTLAKAPAASVASASLPPPSVPSNSAPSPSSGAPAAGDPLATSPAAAATPGAPSSSATAPAPAAGAASSATTASAAPPLAAESSPRQRDSSAAAPSEPAKRQAPGVEERNLSRDTAGASDDSALDEADADLRRGRGREAAALLWTAVSTGNTAAETKLADLYLRGEGVGKSCVQGRVLLTAAAKEGNTDAQQRLSSLLRNGCR